VVTARALGRRAVPAGIAAAAVVAFVAAVREHPRVPGDAARRPPPPKVTGEVRRVSSRPPTVAGRTRTGTGTTVTPFSAISVRVTLTGRQLTRVETLALTYDQPRTKAINDRAEPILRAEALRAGSAKIDTVTGATYTSRSYRQSLQAAIDRARG